MRPMHPMCPIMLKMMIHSKKRISLQMASDGPRSRNGYNKGFQQKYYSKNRDWILEKKKIYNQKNKEKIARYHRQYYLEHKQEINLKHRQWYRKNKINAAKMSRTRM
jgi:hypothetical protein